MKDELISRQAAIKAIYELQGRASTKAELTGISKAWKKIKAMPPVQPEITHCAECAHWKHSTARESYCEVFDWMSKAEDFCSFAERKGEADG